MLAEHFSDAQSVFSAKACGLVMENCLLAAGAARAGHAEQAAGESQDAPAFRPGGTRPGAGTRHVPIVTSLVTLLVMSLVQMSWVTGHVSRTSEVTSEVTSRYEEPIEITAGPHPRPWRCAGRRSPALFLTPHSQRLD